MIIERESIKNVTLFKGKLKMSLVKSIIEKENVLKGYDKIIIIDTENNEIVVTNETVHLINKKPSKIAV